MDLLPNIKRKGANYQPLVLLVAASCFCPLVSGQESATRFTSPQHQSSIVAQTSARQSSRQHSLDQFDQSIDQIQLNSGPYDYRLQEAYQSLGDELFDRGDFALAIVNFDKALHVARVSQGLYHESQIDLLKRLIASEIALQNWTSVDDRYSYLELLYRRVFDVTDPRLEYGLREVTNWHVNAYNVGIDDQRIEHLRRARNLFKARMEIAEATFDAAHPRVEQLKEYLSICERQLFLASDAYREFFISSNRRNPTGRERGRFIATLD